MPDTPTAAPVRRCGGSPSPDGTRVIGAFRRSAENPRHKAMAEGGGPGDLVIGPSSSSEGSGAPKMPQDVATRMPPLSTEDDNSLPGLPVAVSLEEDPSDSPRCTPSTKKERRQSLRLLRRPPAGRPIGEEAATTSNNASSLGSPMELRGDTPDGQSSRDKRRRSLRIRKKRLASSTADQPSNQVRRKSTELGASDAAGSHQEEEGARDGGFAPIDMTRLGQAELAKSFEKIAVSAVDLSHVSTRRSKKRAGRSSASTLESLDIGGTPGSSSHGTGSAGRRSSSKKAKKGRRDTFDLSKRRGLARSARSACVAASSGAGDRGGMDLSIVVSSSTSEVRGNADFVTPKNGTEVDLNAFSAEPDVAGEEADATEAGILSPAVKGNVRALTSESIKERMMTLLPQVKSYNYPCVSARVVAALSLANDHDQTAFAMILPFLQSLVEAEIASLQNIDDVQQQPHFINKRVCFSAYDYSSTMTTLGLVVGQGGGDMSISIKALESVLVHAQNINRPSFCFDLVIQCLKCMLDEKAVSEAMAGTCPQTWFPARRFEKIISYYLTEMRDIKKYVQSPETPISDDHIGVRYRLNDFVGRSIRFHLREKLDTIPEGVIDFKVEKCAAERWGRVVEDGSMSSIMNFALERVNEMTLLYPKLFEFGEQTMPAFFKRSASLRALSMKREDWRLLNEEAYEELLTDIVEARRFLLGARACTYTLDLLTCPGLEEHTTNQGGFEAVEAIALTFRRLGIHTTSEHQHFVLLADVRDLVSMLKDLSGLEGTMAECEKFILSLTKKIANLPTTYKRTGGFISNIRACLNDSKGEHFPKAIAASE